MNPIRYEITFRGEAGAITRAAFEEFDVDVHNGVTVLSTSPLDQAALLGVIDRIASLGLELSEVHPIAAQTDEQK